VILLGGVLTAGCSVAPGDRGCTALGCNDGVEVSFTFRDRGSYVFEVTVDTIKTTCRATLPLSSSPPNPCDREGIFLGLSGSALPPDQHAIVGLRIQSLTAKHLLMRVTRDGNAIATLDRTIDYAVTPGPNGPGCEPKECKSAKLTL
jgi:hypothetical protein